MMPRVVLTPLKVNGEHVPSGKNHWKHLKTFTDYLKAIYLVKIPFMQKMEQEIFIVSLCVILHEDVL